MCIRDRPPGQGSWVGTWEHRENAIFLLLFLYTLGVGSDKLSTCKVLMTKEGSTKMLISWPPRHGVLELRCGYISYSENATSSTLSIYSTLIAIVSRDCGAAFLCHCWILFTVFYDGAVDLQIWALLTRSNCRGSDNQFTIKACGPLVTS